MNLYRGSAPDPAGAYSHPQTPSWWGGGSLPHSKQPHPRCRPFEYRTAAAYPHVTTAFIVLATLTTSWTHGSVSCSSMHWERWESGTVTKN